MLRPTTRLLPLVLVLAACRAAPVRPAAAGAVRPIPRAVVQARMRLRAHDIGGALACLEAGAPLDASRPERTWLLVHVLVGAGRAEATRRAVRRLRPGRFRTALLASIDEEPSRALRGLRAAEAGGGDPWVSLAAAWLARTTGRTREAWRFALTARGRGVAYVDVESWLIEAGVHLEEGRLERAEAAAREASRLEPTDTRADLVRAVAARRAGDVERALDALVDAAERIPENEGYPRAIAHVLRRYRDPAFAARVAGRMERALVGGGPEDLALAGLLAERRGDDAVARRRYEAALARGAHPVPLDRDLRRLAFAAGDHRRGLALLLQAVPAFVRDDPRNLLAGRWRRVEQAVEAAPDGSAPAAARLALGRALRGVGALEESTRVLDRVARPEAGALAARIRGQLALEDDFEAFLEGGFQKGHRKEEPPSLDDALAALAAIARRRLVPEEAAAFQPPWPGLREVPIVGGWLDHSVHTRSPIVRHFRRYGRFLMLGRRGDQPPEAIVLSLASLVPDKPIRTRGRRLCHDEAIGYDRRLGSWLEASGSELGGACLPDGIWIDTDSARSGDIDLRHALAADPERTRLRREAPHLLPPDGPAGAFSLTEPSGVVVRLLERYTARRTDPWGSLQTLIAHEEGHGVEIKRHLPLLRGLPASLRLFASQGFSPFLVEAALEGRAQLAAVAEAPDPDLALAEMILTQPVVEPQADPHAAGYRNGLTSILVHVWQHPERFPAIDRDRRILPQLDRLTNEQIRACARAALGTR
jgi:tetratricopeptide (TPR) repeat protein